MECLNRRALPFLTPGLPFVPAIAVTVNIYLILKLSILTLFRFIVWMTIGFAIYFAYGMKNSNLEREWGKEQIEMALRQQRGQKIPAKSPQLPQQCYSNNGFLSPLATPTVYTNPFLPS
ncbi:unnamed protein product [Darwinula stevensoni]|uniref:Cationic amino acid transporter C-terminal domain-containing protein n=1 Tax=Darwinula stevensoni TaxID=69355 RepID=A0A7R9AFE5_9CRUS|nr:unnamed protein product [Darwinula stevensoni]CAG0903240.1 unnamed protein product [Darwinula stevensoni]